MTHGELFAGIGGFGLAAHWAGLETLWANEIDPFAIKVLKKNFPNTKIYEEDIKKIGKHNLPRVDVLSGGFPCQPFSQAGRREGKDDNRYLWPEMLRVIRELQPTYVIGENVAGLLSMENGETLKRILLDLENEGYNNEVFLIPSAGVGAWHRRDRIWIVAHTDNTRERTSRGRANQNGEKENKRREKQSQFEFSGYSKDATNSSSHRSTTGISGQEQREEGQSGIPNHSSSESTGKNIGGTQRSLGGVADGVSSRVDRYWDHEPEGVPRVAKGVKDRVGRLKGLGNAIVPAVAYEIFKSIIKHYEERR